MPHEKNRWAGGEVRVADQAPGWPRGPGRQASEAEEEGELELLQARLQQDKVRRERGHQARVDRPGADPAVVAEQALVQGRRGYHLEAVRPPGLLRQGVREGDPEEREGARHGPLRSCVRRQVLPSRRITGRPN